MARRRQGGSPPPTPTLPLCLPCAHRRAYGLTICLAGLVVKAADALGWSQFSWGTAAFHYTSAAQCALLFFYLQTLPKPY